MLSSRWAPALVAAVVTGAFALWNPPLRDLAAHTFRAEYFEQHGFAIWNGTWYGGHYLPAYSVLFPPLAALLSPVWVGAVAAVASAHLFDGLVRARGGANARAGPDCGSRRSASLALLANGWLVFALGTAFALGSLRALQLGRTGLAVAAAVGAALSSPVAARSSSLVALVGGCFAGTGAPRAGSRSPLGALVPLAVLGTAVPRGRRVPVLVLRVLAAGAVLRARRCSPPRGSKARSGLSGP